MQSFGNDERGLGYASDQVGGSSQPLVVVEVAAEARIFVNHVVGLCGYKRSCCMIREPEGKPGIEVEDFSEAGFHSCPGVTAFYYEKRYAFRPGARFGSKTVGNTVPPPIMSRLAKVLSRDRSGS